MNANGINVIVTGVTGMRGKQKCPKIFDVTRNRLICIIPKYQNSLI
jgi:hypothetical protein